MNGAGARVALACVRGVGGRRDIQPSPSEESYRTVRVVSGRMAAGVLQVPVSRGQIVFMLFVRVCLFVSTDQGITTVKVAHFCKVGKSWYSAVTRICRQTNLTPDVIAASKLHIPSSTPFRWRSCCDSIPPRVNPFHSISILSNPVYPPANAMLPASKANKDKIKLVHADRFR